MSTTSHVQATKKRLVVLLHGYTSSPAKLEPLKRRIEVLWPGTIPLVPPLRMWLLSLRDPSVIAADVARQIDKLYTSGQYDDIVLIGHSVGALIARKIYVIACGEQQRAPFEDELRKALGHKGGGFPGFQWGSKVERIVLLAAMNRGWRVSHHVSLSRAPLWAAGSLFGQLILRMLETLFRLRAPFAIHGYRQAEHVVAH